MTTVMHLIDTGGPGGAETPLCPAGLSPGSTGNADIGGRAAEGWLSGELRRLSMQPLVLPGAGLIQFEISSALTRTVRQHDVQLIHTHLLGSAVYGALVVMLTRTPFIAVLHGPTDLSYPRLARARKAVAADARLLGHRRRLRQHPICRDGIRCEARIHYLDSKWRRHRPLFTRACR